MKLPFVIAHRGASAYAPENTIASFRKAYELGATWLEFDVVLSADNEAIIFHDDELRRTTNGTGQIAKLDFKQLRELDAGSWFNKNFVGEKIPSLIEVIHFLNKYTMGANIELKPAEGQGIQLAKIVLDMIEQEWRDISPPPLLSSFDWQCLAAVRDINKKVALGLLVDQWVEEALDMAEQLQCCSIHVNQKYLSQKIITEIKASGRLVLSYTVNDAERARQLKDWGVDAVFTDHPNIIIAAMDQAI